MPRIQSANLFSKLLLAFGLVAFCSIGLTALLANRIAGGGLELVITRRAQVQAQRTAPIIAGMYQQAGDWNDVVKQLAPVEVSGPDGGTAPQPYLLPPPAGAVLLLPDQRLILAGRDGSVVYDSDNRITGQRLRPELAQAATPIDVNGAQVGTLLFAESGNSTIQSDYFERINTGLLLVAIVTGALTILVAVVVSRQFTAPISQLTHAAQAIAKGNLQQRVTSGGDDEVGQLAAAFNQMAADLEESERQRRQTLADIAHELRNPLTTIQGTLEGLLDGVQPLQLEQIAKVYDQTVMLSRLVEDLRLLSLAQAHTLHLDLSQADLREVVTNVVATFAPLAEEQGTTLGPVEVNGQIPPVHIDVHRISQVLANLVSNALRYQKEGGRVQVRVDGRATEVAVSVRDTGPGIAPEHLPHVFERFYRVDQSRSRAGGGSGLGLAIARELVVAHGGRIWGESVAGQGSTFTFTIPAMVRPLPPPSKRPLVPMRRTLR